MQKIRQGLLMGKLACLFPGQGSQYVGMGKDLCASEPAARALFDEADRMFKAPFSTVCFDGPEQELRQTRTTQPAIFVHSVAVARLLTSLRPDMVAGHSLGEYSALVAAGSMTFADGLRLVRLRGELMQQAGEDQPGTMAAVVGLDTLTVDEICREASAVGIVQAANLNAPGQVVISGSVEGVRRSMELAKQRGAKLVKELVVSGAFHSPLMAAAGDGLRRELDRTAIRDAEVPVYANVTAAPVTRAADIRDLLHRQLTSPVRWEESIRAMAADGATTFYEFGPGKVLQGLVRRILPGAPQGGFDTLQDIRAQEIP
jgi:[acyl-carrier-protein] S-malonyltransferase